MEYVTKIVNEYNDIVGKLTPAEVRIYLSWIRNGGERTMKNVCCIHNPQSQANISVIFHRLSPLEVVGTNCDAVLTKCEQWEQMFSSPLDLVKI